MLHANGGNSKYSYENFETQNKRYAFILIYYFFFLKNTIFFLIALKFLPPQKSICKKEKNDWILDNFKNNMWDIRI